MPTESDVNDAGQYGRSADERIKYLLKNLSEEEKAVNFRLNSFVQLWFYSTGGSFDINADTDFFNYVNDYSLKKINEVFVKKFGCDIWPTAE